MSEFVLSCFEFRDRVRVILRIQTNSSLYHSVHQPVLVNQLRVVPGDANNWI